MINSWIANDDESWLLELFGDLVGKDTWSPFSTEVAGISVGGILEDGSLGVSFAGNNKNIFFVCDSSNNSGSNHEFFPGLGKIDVVNTFLVSGINVWLHFLGAVLSSKIDLGCKHKCKIVLS